MIKKAWVIGTGSAGGALTVAGLAALANPYRWIWLGDRPLHWWLAGTLGLAFLAVTCVLLAMRRRGRPRALWVSAAVLVLAATAVGALGGLLQLLFSDPGPTRVVDTSADGRFVIVQHDTYAVIDPVLEFYVQSTDGPFSRRALLGCFNHDAAPETAETARFAGPDTVVIEGSKGRWTVRFDRDDVRTIGEVPSYLCGGQLYTG